MSGPASLPILFVGARIVGRLCLEALLQKGMRIAGLLVLDESKAGQTVAHADFADLIEQHHVPARPFRTLKGPEGHSHAAWARELRPRLGIVVGVSELLGPEILSLPELGFIGMHPTFLPEGRGRAPIPWAMILGLKQTGVSLFYAAEGADTGDILLQERVPILEDDTASTLGARTDNVAARLLVDAVEKIATGTAPRIPQDPAMATHWPRRRPEDGVIDWNRPSADVVRWIRALTHPYPGAFTHIGGRKLFIWEAVATTASRGNVPGEILARDDDRLTIATCDGAVDATSFQWADQSNGITSEGKVIARIRSASL